MIIIVPQTCGWIYFHICQITISVHINLSSSILVYNMILKLSLDKGRPVDLPHSPSSWPFDNHIFPRPGNVVCISVFVVLYLTLFVEGKYLERARWEEKEKEDNICNGIIDISWWGGLRDLMRGCVTWGGLRDFRRGCVTWWEVAWLEERFHHSKRDCVTPTWEIAWCK